MTNPWRLISLGKGYFHLLLGSEEIKTRIRRKGALVLNPGTLHILPWRPDFNPDHQKTTKAVVWVRMYGLSWEYWENIILACIAWRIGDLIKADNNTLNGDYRHFSHILVDVDLINALPSTIGVEKEGHQFWVDLVYENVPKFYKLCSTIGHLWQDCNLHKGEPKKPSEHEDQPLRNGAKLLMLLGGRSRQLSGTKIPKTMLCLRRGMIQVTIMTRILTNSRKQQFLKGLKILPCVRDDLHVEDEAPQHTSGEKEPMQGDKEYNSSSQSEDNIVEDTTWTEVKKKARKKKQHEGDKVVENINMLL